MFKRVRAFSKHFKSSIAVLSYLKILALILRYILFSGHFLRWNVRDCHGRWGDQVAELIKNTKQPRRGACLSFNYRATTGQSRWYGSSHCTFKVFTTPVVHSYSRWCNLIYYQRARSSGSTWQTAKVVIPPPGGGEPDIEVRFVY